MPRPVSEVQGSRAAQLIQDDLYLGTHVEHKVLHEQVHLPAMFYHVDGEQMGQWVPGTIPVDKDGEPIKGCGEPDPRYPQGIKTFQKVIDSEGNHVTHTHNGIDGEEVVYYLYKQMHTMTLAHTMRTGYNRDTDQPIQH